MSVSQKQVEELLRAGIISAEQAEKINVHGQEGASSKIITVLSVLGAVFLGVGALLFIGSNWQEISAFGKVLILAGATFGSYWAGYYFAYQKKNLPKVGQALLFLGALLFGVSVFLIAQIYNVEADSRMLLVIWLAGVLPLVYVLRFKPTATLAVLIFYYWFISVAAQALTGRYWYTEMLLLCTAVLIVSLIVFLIGALHYRVDVLAPIARVYRLASLRVAMVVLFILTFRDLYPSTARYAGYAYSYYNQKPETPSAPVMLGIGAILALLGGALAMVFNPAKSKFAKLENGIVAGLAVMSLAVLYVPANQLYPIVFNLIFVGIIIALFWMGYGNRDMKLVNIAMGASVVLIFARYFDFFWDMLPASGFFIVGGTLLLLGGIALERKRREIKQQFAAVPAELTQMSAR